MTLLFALIVFISQSGAVTLQWDPNSEPDLAGYRVYRKAVPVETEFKNLTPELVTETTYTDSTVERGAIYQYYVTAWNTANYSSDPSNIVEVTIPLEEPEPEPEIDLSQILADISELQAGTRDLRDQADLIRLAIQELEDQLGNDPEMITRRYVAGNAVRQYEIILSHLNALVRLLGEVESE